MHYDIAIVVAAYNRPDSLQRLLGSLASADYGSFTNVPLIISIDHSGSNECQEIADLFNWQHGSKTILHHANNLGLKKHILYCGDFTYQYDAIIVLEDDLLVSPAFYSYAQQAYDFYKTDEQVAGIALYHNIFNEIVYCPFEPIHDGYDNYFMQVPCSWGQVWTKLQWAGFKRYMNEVNREQFFGLLPANVQLWRNDSSWKKYFYSYLQQAGTYFVYPRVGLSTNFGDAGQHLVQSQTVFQTPLLLAKKEFRFSSMDESLSIYDGFFELDGSVYNKMVDKEVSVTFDLNGSKPIGSIRTKLLISSKISNDPLVKYSVSCYPYENNILLNIKAPDTAQNFYSLAETKTYSDKQQFDRLPADLQRVFLNDVFLKRSVRKEMEQTKEYYLGYRLLQPLRYLKNLFKKQGTDIQLLLLFQLFNFYIL
jgi:Glycosyl transferase family 2